MCTGMKNPNRVCRTLVHFGIVIGIVIVITHRPQSSSFWGFLLRIV